jgi:hypothetical protein
VNLREAFEATPKRRSGVRCATCTTLEQMDAEDRDTLIELLKSDASSFVISAACKTAGYPKLTEGTLKRHRRGDCGGLT